MKKILLFLFFIIGFIYSFDTFAHPGRTASDGCHYCRTNCDSRGVARNQRHCHGTTTTPTYDYTPTTVTCPSNSYKIGSSCYCNVGYYSSGGICIKEQTCSDLYGIGSYETIDNKCSCSSGYTWGTDILGNNKCITVSKYCSDEFGYGSEWSYLNNQCVCKTGYIVNDSGDGCIYKTTNIYNIENKISCGLNSIATDNGDCQCKEGYKWETEDETNLDCVKMTTENMCIDSINGYLGSDYKCYCNIGYNWSDDESKCIENISEYDKLKIKYKELLISKLGTKLDKIPDTTLEKLLKQINNYLVKKLNNDTKAKLEALKEIVEEKLSNDNILDDILNDLD